MHHALYAFTGEGAETQDQSLAQLAAGTVDLEVTTVAGLDQASAAQQALAEGRGRGKQVVELIAGL